MILGPYPFNVLRRLLIEKTDFDYLPKLPGTRVGKTEASLAGKCLDQHIILSL